MKIAYILNAYPQPSQSFIRRELAELETLGHDVLRLAMRPGDAPLVDAQDQAEAARTEYVLQAGGVALLAGLLRAFVQGPGRWFAALRLAVGLGRRSESGVLRHLIYFAEAAHVAARCRAEGVTHAHAHFGTNAAAVAMLSHALGGPRYSFTVHGPEEFDSPRALSLGQKIAHSAFTVAISHYGRSQLCRWAAPGDWDKIRVVHCGIVPARFPEPAPLPDGPLRMVAIGRLVEQKGQLLLIEALARLKADHADIHLTLIGDGELRGEIEAAIARAGLEQQVTLTGWVDERRILSELAGSHALVMSSFAEGLPMVIMEAMAAGRVVLATHIAGTPELVVPGETGFLVPAGDAEGLAEGIARLATTPRPELQKIATAGRARALARHDVAREAAKLAGFMAG